VKGSVLIADDEPLARRTLREHLLGLGWAGSIHEAQDGVTAIRIANQQRPDLVFLDIVMPGVTGLKVLEQLDYEPKVIFTTAQINMQSSHSNLAPSTTFSSRSDATDWSVSFVGRKGNGTGRPRPCCRGQGNRCNERVRCPESSCATGIASFPSHSQAWNECKGRMTT
jgi:CheY-like chemotaxis protein